MCTRVSGRGHNGHGLSLLSCLLSQLLEHLIAWSPMKGTQGWTAICLVGFLWLPQQGPQVQVLLLWLAVKREGSRPLLRVPQLLGWGKQLVSLGPPEYQLGQGLIDRQKL